MLARSTLAASFLFALAGPVLAEGFPPSGYVGASYGQSTTKLRSLLDADADVLELEGAVNFALASALGLQIDGEYTLFEPGRENDGFFNASTHLAFRNARYMMAGAFVGLGKSADDEFYGGGLQTQVYFKRFTLYASGGAGKLESSAGDERDVTGGRIQGRFYPRERLAVRFAGSVAELSGDVAGASFEQQYWGARGELEYQMSGSPISVYSGVQYGQDDGADARNTKVVAGLRWNFSTDTLYARDRAGATHDGARELVGFDAIPFFN